MVRVKRVRTNDREERYLEVAETRCDRGRVVQPALAHFGRLDEVVASGALDRVIEALVAHAKTRQLIQWYRGGAGPAGLARLGLSKDHRPDHPQVILGVLRRRDGLPIACEVWPGNGADVTRLGIVAELLPRRLPIERVVVAADRGDDSPCTRF